MRSCSMAISGADFAPGVLQVPQKRGRREVSWGAQGDEDVARVRASGGENAEGWRQGGCADAGGVKRDVGI